MKFAEITSLFPPEVVDLHERLLRLRRPLILAQAPQQLMPYDVTAELQSGRWRARIRSRGPLNRDKRHTS